MFHIDWFINCRFEYFGSGYTSLEKAECGYVRNRVYVHSSLNKSSNRKLAVN